MEYIQNNGVVLHEIMLFSLMECAELVTEKEVSKDNGVINWNQFLSLCLR